MTLLTGRSIWPGLATILTPCSFARAMRSSASAAVVVIVLLKWTCLPASIAARPCSKCSPMGEQIVTASTLGSPSSSSNVS